MKRAFLVDTGLQLFNCILFITTNGLNGENDLFVYAQFLNSDSIIKRVIESGLFNNVYVLERNNYNHDNKLQFLGGLLSPSKFIEKKFGASVKKDSYDEIYVSTVTRLFDLFIVANGNDNIYGIDDGIGCYSKDFYRLSRGKKYDLLKRICGHEFYTIKKLYLTFPDFFDGEDWIETDELIGNSVDRKETIKVLKRIFGFVESDLYKNNKLVYFNQPLSDFKGNHINEEQEIYNLLKRFKPLVRLHPREKNAWIYDNALIDNENNMWELICDDINENHILIGICSTTQFTPKLQNNIEPTLIFTYKLYSVLSERQLFRFSNSVNRLKRIYSDPNKIMVVESLHDLEHIMEKVYNNRVEKKETA